VDAERRATAAGALAIALLGLAAGGLPLLVGPPGGDDAYYHAMYAQQHAWCWRNGALHPRWYPGLNDGLGGPEPRSRPLAALAVQAALALALDDAVAASSVVTLAIPPAAGLLMLWAARRRGAAVGPALAAAGAWALAPYLLVSLHQRAALQEAAALALLPPALAALLPGARNEGRVPLGGAFALAALLSTQLIVALMAGLVVLAAWLAARPRALLRAAAAVGAALALAALSWLPNVVSLARIRGDAFASGWFDWRTRFLLAGGAADPDLDRRLAYALAGTVAAALLLAVAERGTARRLALGALAAALLATPASRWVWEVVPGLAMIQFPWRWLGPAACLAALALAAARRARVRLAGAALLLLPALAVPWFSHRLPAGRPLRPSEPAALAAAAATRYGVPAILPSFPATLPRGVDLGEALAGGAAARAALPAPEAAGPLEWRWRIDAPAARAVALPLLADAAWRAEVDGAPAPGRAGGGLLVVDVPAGARALAVRQALLWEEWVGAALSLAAAVVLALARHRRVAALSGTASRPPRSPAWPR